MKVLLFIFLTSSFFLFSQENKKQVFTLKPALGLNGCQIHGDGYSGYDKAGIFGGIAVNAFINSKTSLEMGFYLSQKGARKNPVPAKGDYSQYYVNLNYIDLPLLLRYHLNKDYFVTVGPSIAYMFNYYESVNYTNYTGAYNFNSIEYGINLGLGKKIKEKFSVEVRTSNSLLPIRDYGGWTSTVFYPNPVAQFFNKGLYNNVLTLFVAYKLDLKRKIREQE